MQVAVASHGVGHDKVQAASLCFLVETGGDISSKAAGLYG